MFHILCVSLCNILAHSSLILLRVLTCNSQENIMSVQVFFFFFFSVSFNILFSIDKPYWWGGQASVFDEKSLVTQNEINEKMKYAPIRKHLVKIYRSRFIYMNLLQALEYDIPLFPTLKVRFYEQQRFCFRLHHFIV